MTKPDIRHKSGRTDAACFRDDTGTLAPARASKSQIISLPIHAFTPLAQPNAPTVPNLHPLNSP